MLYTVPPRSDDDWYWVYATVYQGRNPSSAPAFVVSNDLMRDHRAAFAEPKAFLRWRNSQIIYFGFSHAVVGGSTPTGGAGGVVNKKRSDTSTNWPLTQQQQQQQQKPKREVTETAPEVYLYEPGNFSRDIQRLRVQEREREREEQRQTTNESSADVGGSGDGEQQQQQAYTGRWHFPSVDRNLWLCVDTSGGSDSDVDIDLDLADMAADVGENVKEIAGAGDEVQTFTANSNSMPER